MSARQLNLIDIPSKQHGSQKTITPRSVMHCFEYCFKSSARDELPSVYAVLPHSQPLSQPPLSPASLHSLTPVIAWHSHKSERQLRELLQLVLREGAAVWQVLMFCHQDHDYALCLHLQPARKQEEQSMRGAVKIRCGMLCCLPSSALTNSLCRVLLCLLMQPVEKTVDAAQAAQSCYIHGA